MRCEKDVHGSRRFLVKRFCVVPTRWKQSFNIRCFRHGDPFDLIGGPCDDFASSFFVQIGEEERNFIVSRSVLSDTFSMHIFWSRHRTFKKREKEHPWPYEDFSIAFHNEPLRQSALWSIHFVGWYDDIPLISSRCLFVPCFWPEYSI